MSTMDTKSKKRRARVVLHGVIIPLVLAMIAACDHGHDTTGPITITTAGDTGESTTEASSLLILGGMGARLQNIWIFQGGWDITDGVSDAEVTVNGVTIPWAGFYPGYYSGGLPVAVPPDAPLDLRVSARGLVVEATNRVPEGPVITTPSTGAIVASSGSITVRWTSASSPDRFGVYVNTNRPVWDRQLPGRARELEIVASELPKGQFTLSVVGFNDGRFSGPAHPDSRMGTMSAVSSITIER